VPEHQELGILGHLTPGQHHLTAEQTANEQVDDREHHSAMIPTRLPAQAGSSNRAPHVVHAAAQLTRSARQVWLRIDRTWRWAAQIAEGFHRLRAAFA
jgi:hypothetical protein